MAYKLIDEHMVGSRMVGDIERLYRCDNGYGALVGIRSPGDGEAGHIVVTPVQFHGKGANDYRVCSTAHVTEGLESGELLDPKLLSEEEELETLLQRIDELPRLVS